MKFLAPIFLFLLPFISFGINSNEKNGLYNHLIEVNENWKFQNPLLFSKLVSFDSDVDRIQRHLFLVEQNLRSKSTKHLDQTQKNNRSQLLDILHHYSIAKAFPINTGHANRQPYFIDNYGTHCAVGFLIKASGFGQISHDISKTQNFAYVKEIESADLVNWSVDFGFSLEELAWIQPGYLPTQTYSQVGGGTNGTVTRTYNFQPYDRLYLAGDFTELNSLPCLNVGYYQNNQLSCFGGGIAGKIVGLAEIGTNGVIVAGEFQNNGITYPMARYDGVTWTYHDIPGIPNAKATSFSSQGSGNYILIAVSAPSLGSSQEIWRSSNNSWTKQAEVPGLVYAFSNTGFQVFAGHFSSINIFENGVGTVYPAKNFITRNFNSEWVSALTDVPDTIKTVYVSGTSVLLGGNSPTSSNGVLLSKYLNGVSQPLLFNSDFSTTNGNPEINDLDMYDPTKLVVVGYFVVQPFVIGTFGSNVITYDLVSSYYFPIIGLDSTANTVNVLNGKLIIGGAFTKDHNSVIPDKNHLIQMNGYVQLMEEDTDPNFSISPNPSNGKLTLKGADIEKVQVTDALGKIFYTGKTLTIELYHLPIGIYFVQVTDRNGLVGTKKWLKD